MGYTNCDEYHLDTDTPTGRALAEVEIERIKQKEKWGEQNHDMYRWLAILMEEVGEAAQAMLHVEQEGTATADDVKEELIQTAAVCIQILECIDRRGAVAAPPDGKHGWIYWDLETNNTERP